MAIHTGIVGGRLSPNKTPVTTALRSRIVCFLFKKYAHKNSVTTHASTVDIITRITLAPKKYVPAMHAGINAITTSSIMPLVVSSCLKCGDEDKINRPSKILPPLHR
jgi:hypothetical protein